MIDISSRVLRAMIVLAELRNFSLAAERCHVTQSALSQMVRKLEGDLGLQLVDRNRRNLTFTAEGLRFVDTAKRILQELEEIHLDLREHASGRRGRVRIAATPSVAAHWLPSVFAQYKATFPSVELGLFDVPAEAAMELVRSRQAELAITADGQGRPGLDSRLLFLEKLSFVCHRSHRLASKQRVSFSDLDGCTYIRSVRTGNLALHLNATLPMLHLVDSGFEVNRISSLAGLVAANLGVTIVTELLLPYFDGASVVSIPLGPPELRRPVHLVWPKGKKLSAATEAFVDTLHHSKAAISM